MLGAALVDTCWVRPPPLLPLPLPLRGPPPFFPLLEPPPVLGGGAAPLLEPPEGAPVVLERHPPGLVQPEPADARRAVVAMLFSS